MWLRAFGACEALAGKRGQAQVFLPTELYHLHHDMNDCSKGALTAQLHLSQGAAVEWGINGFFFTPPPKAALLVPAQAYVAVTP